MNRKKIVFIGSLVFLIMISSSFFINYRVKIYVDGEFELVEKIRTHKDIDQIDRDFIDEDLAFEGWFLDEFYRKPYSKDIKIRKIKKLYAKVSLKTIDVDGFLEIYNQALDNHLAHRNYSMTTTGSAKAQLATQEIYGYKHIIGDDIDIFSASHGLVKTYMNLVGSVNDLKLKKGTVKADFTVDKESSNTPITLNDFIDVYGVSPYELNYVITKELVKELINYTLMDGIHKFHIELKIDSTINYAKSVTAMNTQENRNLKFSKILLTIAIDENGYFKYIEYDEHYTVQVKVGLWITQSIDNKVRDDFEYK